MAKRKITYDSKETTVVDRQTGEVAKIELQKRSKIYIDSEPFYMVFIDYLAPLYDLKNGTSKAVLSWLCSRAQFNTGKVSISAEDRKEMSAELDISKVTITQCLKELVTKKLISGKGGSYVINPQIFWRGDLLSRNALLDTKEIQITFSINPESADLEPNEKF